jgi:hypothetical protein
MAAECRRRPRKRLPSALAKRLLRDTTLRVAVTPPQSSEGLAEAASASWASSAAEILGEHLRAHPESVERALGESDDSAVVTPAEIGRMSAEWWQSLVAEHMRQWGDYPIPVEPEEALRALRSPWGRQSRSDWCRLLCRSFDECGIGTYKLGNWPKGVD